MKRYKERPDALFFQISLFIFGIPASIAVQYTIIINAPIFYRADQFGQLIAACIIFSGCILLEYLCVEAIRELKTVASTVELTDDRVIGFSRFGKHHWEMRYEDINTITPKQNGWALILKDKEDNKMMVSIFAHPFGDCMETIQKKAVNAIKIDFGRHKDNKRIWKMS